MLNSSGIILYQAQSLSFPGFSRSVFRIPGFSMTKIEIQGFLGFPGGIPNPDKINIQGGGALENSIGTVQHVPLFLFN